MINALIILIASFSAIAGPPALTSDCFAAARVLHPRGSGGVLFDKECTTAYVLPPLRGEIKLEGLIESANMLRCQELHKEMGTLGAITSALRELDFPTKDEGRGDSDCLGGDFCGEGEQTDVKMDEVEKEKRRKELATLRHDLELRIQNIYGRTVAAEGLLGIVVDHNRMVDNYQKLNANLFVFKPIVIRSGVLSQIKSEVNTDLPIFLDTGIAGLKVREDEKSIDFQAGLNTAMSGKVKLSMVGACRLSNYSPYLPPKVGSQRMGVTLGVTLNYKMEFQAHAGYTATYNLAALAKEIRKHTTSGGLFTTSSANEVFNSYESSGWFTFKSECDNSSVCIKEQLALSEMVRARLMKQVIEALAMTKYPGVANPTLFDPPSKSGAAVAAEGLHKCPNVYCQIGAMVLDVANAIFGGKSRYDQFIESNNSTQTETVKLTDMIEYSGQTHFGLNK